MDYLLISPFVALCVASYLLGSIPFGYILTKTFLKEDIRKSGSGNIGATNVLRTGKKSLAAATLLLDGGKAAVASQLHFLLILNLATAGDTVQYDPFKGLILATLAALGHCFPIWLKFKGGKGVATALGALLAAVPYAGLAACATWLITAKITKISSLSALIAVLIAPIVTFFVYGVSPAGICAMITLLVWIRHKDNIKRLLKGEEPKIGSKKKKEEPVESVSND